MSLCIRSSRDNPWLFAVMLGLCASSSSTPAETSTEARQSAALRIGDLDDVLPIVLGATRIGLGARGNAAAPAPG